MEIKLSGYVQLICVLLSIGLHNRSSLYGVYHQTPFVFSHFCHLAVKLVCYLFCGSFDCSHFRFWRHCSCSYLCCQDTFLYLPGTVCHFIDIQYFQESITEPSPNKIRIF
jgi:hypothetical protein